MVIGDSDAHCRRHILPALSACSYMSAFENAQFSEFDLVSCFDRGVTQHGKSVERRHLS